MKYFTRVFTIMYLTPIKAQSSHLWSKLEQIWIYHMWQSLCKTVTGNLSIALKNNKRQWNIKKITYRLDIINNQNQN